MKNLVVVNGNLGRNTKTGRFVNLANVTVAAKETKETKEKKVKAVETVEAPKKEKKPKGPVVVIDSAVYGAGENTIEVASKLVIGRKITNKLVGEDPAPKTKKILVVKATIDGNPVEKTFNEGDKLTF